MRNLTANLVDFLRAAAHELVFHLTGDAVPDPSPADVSCPRADSCGNHGQGLCDVQPRCIRARRCLAAERFSNGDREIAVGAPSARPLCVVCERAVADTLSEVPVLYVRLRNATLVRGRASHGGDKVDSSPGSPMPLNGRALHLGEQIHWLLTTWEDEVRSIAKLSYPDRTGKREGRQVTEAARLLAAYLTAWIAAPLTEIATSRWTDDITQSGAQAACALLAWRESVRRLPGFDTSAPKPVRRYEQPCRACGVRAITHRAGDDLMQCQSCGATSPYEPPLPRSADASYRTDAPA